MDDLLARLRFRPLILQQVSEFIAPHPQSCRNLQNIDSRKGVLIPHISIQVAHQVTPLALLRRLVRQGVGDRAALGRRLHPTDCLVWRILPRRHDLNRKLLRLCRDHVLARCFLHRRVQPRVDNILQPCRPVVGLSRRLGLQIRARLRPRGPRLASYLIGWVPLR